MSLLSPPSPEEWIQRYKDPAREILFAFDFDGTLSPLVANPAEAVLMPEAARNLARASLKWKMVLCSGRSIRDLKTKIPSDARLEWIGNHGAEIEINGVHQSCVPATWWSDRERLIQELLPWTSKKTVWIEDKGESLTLHLIRDLEVAREWESEPRLRWLKDLTGQRVSVMEGKWAWNLVPCGISKGLALEELVKTQRVRSVVYFGDETTDESVFEQFAQNEHSVMVKVGPGPSAARYRVSEVREVLSWMAQLSTLDSGLI